MNNHMTINMMHTIGNQSFQVIGLSLSGIRGGVGLSVIVTVYMS
jgi:hypothetical protein